MEDDDYAKMIEFLVKKFANIDDHFARIEKRFDLIEERIKNL